jgi:hypothetical protein
MAGLPLLFASAEQPPVVQGGEREQVELLLRGEPLERAEQPEPAEPVPPQEQAAPPAFPTDS